MTAPLAAIFGLSGTTLTADERAFFADADPLGFILFARNIERRGQISGLISSLRETVGRLAPILIDQEGGRVQRLAPPRWRLVPPAARFGRIADPDKAARAAWLNARLMAVDLSEIGIDVDCAPVLDLPAPGAHAIIGDRAYGCDPATVIRLGRAVADGLLQGGVLPVIKHIPGHGRAAADSHEDRPVVAADRAALDGHDFAPFRALADLPIAMTAHVVYEAFDPDRVATLSPIVIEDVIRRRIGFDGLLVTDDLGMKALGGPLGARAEAARRAGCDVALHCSGDLDEMRAVAAGAGRLDGPSARRVRAALKRREAPPLTDIQAFGAELADLMLGSA